MSAAEETTLDVKGINFHPVLKDIENMFWLFLLSMRTLSDFDIQKLLRTKNTTNKGYECFNYMLDKFNETTNFSIEIKGNVATSKLTVLNEMIFTGKAMTIFIYQLLESSDYIETVKNDGEFYFLTHIRNGAAHNNKFDLKHRFGKMKGQWRIQEDETIKWNDKEITRKVQETTVFNDFISLGNIFLLAEHFSNRLKEIDNKSK